MINQSPLDINFQAQRDRLFKFHEHFSKSLLHVISDLGSEIATLKDRTFDSKMLGLLVKVYQDLIAIYKQIRENDPYSAAQMLVRLVMEKPGSSIISNLDFLGKHHLQSTNDKSLRTSEHLQHPQMRSLDALKELASYSKSFMLKYPMLNTKKLMEEMKPDYNVPDSRDEATKA